MKFIYGFARLPKDRELLIDINSAAIRLFDKLRALDVEALDISDYNKRYFGGKLVNLTASLQLYSYILAWSLADTNTSLNKFTFLDYGGGSGMLSLLAKEVNIGTVIYNDIYDVSCKDARVLAKSVGNEVDYYVNGDIDDVISFLVNKNAKCDAIASYDVIEHIYDIEYFLRRLKHFPNGSLTVCMSSSANIFFKRYTKKIMKEQYEVEHHDREKELGHKERDTTRAYLKIRREMILEYTNKKLNENEVERLAAVTRGMMHSDILKCVNMYLKTKQFPKELDHPTNTCDPYTGNWMEHLMNPYKLKDILSKESFDVEILGGYRGSSKSIKKRVLRKLGNVAIYLLGKQGLFIAPFFTIYGKRNTV